MSATATATATVTATATATATATRGGRIRRKVSNCDESRGRGVCLIAVDGNVLTPFRCVQAVRGVEAWQQAGTGSSAAYVRLAV
jgi:hypothetical protein